MKSAIRVTIIFVALAFAGTLLAQEHNSAAQPPHENSAQQNAAPGEAAKPDQGTHASAGQQLAHESEEAAGEEDEHDNLKRSAAVKWIGSKLGIGDTAAYWLFVLLNFGVLMGMFWWFARKSVPAMFRNRTESIQKGIEEARKASTEASARLTEIEARLSRLDDEVEQIRAAAAKDFSAEEQRIKEAAEQDARNVVDSAQQEIEAASRSAQRELRTYAAELAVSMAKTKIKVDGATDQALVNDFVAQLGKEGK